MTLYYVVYYYDEHDLECYKVFAGDTESAIRMVFEHTRMWSYTMVFHTPPINCQITDLTI